MNKEANNNNNNSGKSNGGKFVIFENAYKGVKETARLQPAPPPAKPQPKK